MIFRYSANTAFPDKYTIKMNVRVTSIKGTVANPSKPSVKFTALEEPIITIAANGK